MNNKVRKQDLEKLLFLDIETVRRNKELELNSKEYDLYAWKLRDKETSKLPPSNEVLEHYKLNGALDPTFNKIVCITIGFIKGTTLYLKSLTGDQKTIIEEFYGILNSTGFIPCGHNIIQFDMPTIRLKAFESGVNLELLSDKYSDSQQKPWILAENLTDTMDITKGTYYYNLSLDSMCFLAGIETPKDDISGVDVSRVYWEEAGLQRISEYCKKDVKAVAELFCALQGKKDFITDVVDKTDNTPIIEYSILEQLHYNGMTEEVRQGLKQQIFGKKKPTKDEKEKLFEIIRGVWIKTDFENSNQDSKKIIEEKEKQIKELLEM